jgi:hypothetical protein
VTSNVRFSQPVQLFWCCNSRGRLRLVFHETTYITNLWKRNKWKFTAQ